MIILDTNVISEFTKPMVSERVATWFAARDPLELATTCITEAELLVGIALLPAGRRKTDLARETIGLLQGFGSRIFSFDREAAQQLPAIMLQRRAARLPIDHADGQIAAIARLHGAPIATRNVDDFKHAGIELINPWTERP